MLKDKIDYKLTDMGIFYLRNNTDWVQIQWEGYKFESIIAAGANGVVIKSLHVVTGRKIAVKIWKPRSSDFEVYQKHFLNEIRKISNIKHQNILTAHDGFVHDSGFCLASFDFIEGITIKDWIKKEQPKHVRIKILKDTLDTVYYYQTKGVFHGDLHTGNILISPDNAVCIIDFGTSMFSEQDQSKERECYFVALLVKQLISDFSGYSDEHFAFKYNKRNLSVRDLSYASLKLKPLLLTETMVGYLKIVEILTFSRELDLEDLRDVCIFASQTRYLNIVDLMHFIMNNCINVDKYNVFMHIMYQNISHDLFPEIVDDYDFAQLKYYASTFVYYKLIKTKGITLINPVTNKNIILNFEEEENKTVTNEYNCIILELKKWLEYHIPLTYFEILNEITLTLESNNISVHEKIRRILYYSLIDNVQKRKENIFELRYWINTRVNELLCDTDIHNEINDYYKMVYSQG